MEKPEGKKLLWRARRRWNDNIKIYLREIGWGDADWIYLAQDRNQWLAFVDSDEPSGERLAASQEGLNFM
jgi:hypothetical protein